MQTNILTFVSCLIISFGVYRLFRKTKIDTAIGGIVMSLGIFSTFALRELPFYTPLVGRIAGLEVLVVWLLTTFSLINAFYKKDLQVRLRERLQKFAIGTWVAATAVLTTLLAKNTLDPTLLEYTLASLTFIIYIPYVSTFVTEYIRLWRHPAHQKTNGTILLPTVATESVIIMALILFNGDISKPIAISLIAFDLLFLSTSQLLIALHFVKIKTKDLADKWPNANCIIHGGVSITGLTLVLSRDFSPLQLFGVWTTCFLLFILVESIEVVRAIQRLQKYGFRRGLAVYEASQWSRNFTFGMFYAFTFELQKHFINFPFNWEAIINWIVVWGKYIVFGLLVYESTLAIASSISKSQSRSEAT